MSKINFEITGIGKLISDKQLSIPIYQRAYAWEEKNINELFLDIHNSINEDEYFIGTIVIAEKENEKRREIVDGQQRLATIVIFLSAVRNYFKQKSNTDYEKSIENNYLSKFDLRTGNVGPKLQLGNQDNQFFYKLVIKNEDVNAKKDSHKRIQSAFCLAQKQVDKLIKLSNENLDQLHNWIEFIDEKLKVVLITVPSHANAFTIFETLNDRGLELAQTDLLKNYLYSKVSSERLSEVQNVWIEMASLIESAEDENLVLKFIRHYWSSKYGLTREKNKELYNDIKKKIRNSNNAIDFVNNLKNDAELYLAILNHNHPYWKTFGEKTKPHLETLNFFNLEQFRPLLLSILKKFADKKEIEKSLKLLVSWLVRNLIVGALGGGTLEKEYSNKAKEINEGTIKNSTELKSFLTSIIPSDDEFKEKFITATVSKAKYARYYLRAIENQHSGKGYPELLVNSDPDAVNLEHILPQNPESNCSNFTQEEADSFYKRIGNLTLMKTKPNSEFGNSSFDEKKKEYSKSDLWITKSLEKYDKWTPDTIKKRQKELAELAIKTWNMDLG